MKKALLVFVMIMVSFGAQWVYADTEAPTIAIFPMKGQRTRSGVIGNPDEFVIQSVTDAFIKTKRFNVMERSQLGTVYNELKLQTTGDFDYERAVELGKQQGAKFIVLGSYDATITQEAVTNNYGRVEYYQYPSKFEINIRVVDAMTGKIMETVKVLARAKESEQSRSYEKLKEDVIRKIEREVANKYPLVGYVIKVLGENEALIDIGKKDGLTEDSEFSVFEYGEDIVHPVTKKVLKGEKKLITEFKVKNVGNETSTVKVSGDSATLKVGLMLESKPKEAGFMEGMGNFFNR